MKKNLILCLAFCLLSNLSFAQTLVQENFDAAMPGTWTITDGGGATGDSWASGMQGGTNSLDGTNCAIVDSDANGNGTLMTETMTTQAFNATGAGSLWLDFDQYYRSLNTSDTAIVEVFDGTVWQQVLVQADASIGAFNTPDLQHIDISAYKNAAMQVRFYFNDNNTWAWYWLVDNVHIYLSSCANPTALAATTPSATSADLAWTEAGTATSWEVEYGAAGFTQGTGTSVVTTTNPHNITGLTANTSYGYYVRAICGVGDTSIWSGPFVFTTPCAAMAAPWMDSVEAHTATTALTISQCWSATSVSAYDWNIDGLGSTPSSGTGPTGAYSGANYFYIEASTATVGDEAVLTSPLVDVSALTSPALEFYYHMFGTTVMGDLYIDAYNGSVWTTVDSIKGQQQTAQADPWLIRTINLAGYTGNIQVRFRAICNGTFQGDISLDDIAIVEAPSCFTPTTLTTANILYNAADLGWTENGTATSWEIEYGAAGFAQGTGTSVVTSTNPHNLTGLTHSTSYGFYVRAICGVGDTSAWLGPLTFVTPPSCPAPTSLTANTPSATSADLAWTEAGAATSWEVEYGAAGFAQGTGTAVVTSTNPHNITGLTSNTAYGFYVRAICGAGDTSTWSGPFTFSTPCTAMTAPWMDSVEAHTATTTLGISQCWSATSASAYDWNIDGLGSTPSVGTGPTGAYSGVNYFYVEASSGAVGDLAELTSPLVDISAVTSPTLEFYYHMFGDGNGVMGDLYIDVYDGATWVVVDSIKGEQQAAQADPWLKRTIALSAFSGTIQVKFRAYKNGNQWGDVSLDDIAITGTPIPSDVSAASFLNLNATYCNAGTITASVIITNMTAIPETNVPYVITANGAPVGGGTIATLAGNASDTITVGPLPATTGVANIMTWTALPGDANLANDTISMMVSVSNTTASASVTAAIMCNGDSTGEVRALGADGLALLYNYQWDAAAGNAITSIVPNLPAGMYAVTVTDSIGCADSTMVTLTEPATAVSATDSVGNVMCNGDSTGTSTIMPAGGTGAYTFMWSTGGANADAINLGAGTYQVTVTDANGCMAMLSSTITEPTALSATDSVANVMCNGDSTGTSTIMPAGGTGTYTFMWSTGGANADAVNLGAGAYQVTVTDANGCMTMLTSTIIAPTPIVASIVDNADGTATASATGGTGAYTYLWDAAAANQTDAIATGLSNGTYNVTVTDANGCMNAASVTITGLGLGQIANLSNLNIFPNPTSGNVFVELDLINNADVNINITNAIGQLVASRVLNNVQSEKVELETSNLPSGIYMVQFTIGQEQLTRKLIVSKQ